MSETESDDLPEYEVVVVGGGPAGLTTALYTTRLGHDTAVVDRGGGRAAMMMETHNVIGITEDVSGNEFLQTAREQVSDYGASTSPNNSSSPRVSPTNGRTRRCPGRAAASTTVCTVMPTCSSTSRST